MNFGNGLLAGLGLGLGMILAIGLAAAGLRMFARDDSDAPGRRSGLLVLTDHGTGREHLMSPMGHLTPRLDKTEGDHGR